MARLIDVTDLINKCKSLSNEHETTSISYNALYEVLLQQPTAYDVEKVVEDIEEFYEEAEHYGFASAISDIVEVVRKGGVNG